MPFVYYAGSYIHKENIKKAQEGKHADGKRHAYRTVLQRPGNLPESLGILPEYLGIPCGTLSEDRRSIRGKPAESIKSPAGKPGIGGLYAGYHRLRL